MAIKVIPYTSPRIIIVLAPDTEITLQNLVNQVMEWEEKPWNMTYPRLIKPSGKQDLGGGVSVGITAELQNAKLAFEARTTSVASGTVTTADSNGITLTDSSATFVSSGITQGACVQNLTDKSVGTVLTVDSETQITLMERLADGTDNAFDLNDEYKIWNEVQTNVTGGNLVAVDENGNSMDPIMPTSFTQVVKTSSASATIASLEIVNLQRLIETTRSHHSGTGNIWYWDPYGGDDENTGDLPTRAVKTFAQAHSLAEDNNHDIIMCVPGNPSGATIVDEQLTITKNYLFVRGPGRDFIIQPTATTGDTITINAEGVEISGMQIKTATSGTTQNCISINDHFALIKNCWIEHARKNGVVISNSKYTKILECVVEHNGESGSGDGIVINSNTREAHIKDCSIWDNTNGISLSGTSIDEVLIEKNIIHNNSSYGVNIGTGVYDTYFGHDNILANNTAGAINDQGTDTHVHEEVDRQETVDAIWDEATADHTTSGSFGEEVQKHKNVLVDTTIASVTSQTVFTLAAGSNVDDTYNDQAIVLSDASNSNYPSVRQVNDYVGSTKQVTIDSAPDFTIVSGDGIRIFVTAPGTTAPTAAQVADAVWDEATADHTTSGTYGKDVADTRTSQQKEYNANLSADYKVELGGTYRCKLFLLNYETVLTNANSTPTITIYDADRNEFKTNQNMTWLATGIYEYTVTIGSGESTGTWESEVTIDLDGSTTIKTSGYFEVVSSGA
jgi:hypothetical protein